MTLELGDSFHYGRKLIKGSQVSMLPVGKRNNWDHKRRKDLAVKLLEGGDFDKIRFHEINFDMSPAYFDQLRNGTVEEIATVIKYPS